MGWYYSLNATRTEVINELTSSASMEGKDGGKVERKTLAKSFKGRYSGTLYAVHEDTFFKADGSVEKARRWIGVYLFKFRKDDGWGYKPMEEGMGPFSYSCPLKYLGMVPEVAHQAWRDGVIHYHARRKLGFRGTTGFKLTRCPKCKKTYISYGLEPILQDEGESPFPGTKAIGLCPQCGGRCYSPAALVGEKSGE